MKSPTTDTSGRLAACAPPDAPLTRALINTPLQRGGIGSGQLGNRFNGLPTAPETVETVHRDSSAPITPLKRGVNEILPDREGLLRKRVGRSEGGEQSAFTMIEIAISLAVIAFALVAIIGILPFAMNVQRDNRQETIINQDATMFLNAIRNGDRGMDDLTNYVLAITNYTRLFQAPPRGGVYTPGPLQANGYTPTNAVEFGSPSPFWLTNGYRIVGLLSTPKYIPDPQGRNMFRSNHVVAFVRSLSGPAVEKYPQNDPTVQQLALNYRLIAEVLNYGTNTFYDGSWTNFMDQTIAGLTNEIIIRSNYWRMVKNLQPNFQDVRLTFRWPLLPNGSAGLNRQLYRTYVTGHIINQPPNSPFYFIQPHTFVKGT